MKKGTRLAFLLWCLLIILGTQLVACSSPPKATGNNKPVFPANYQVQGILSLPYAELNEPFTAWFDKYEARSRTDYYGDLYKIYQFGPKSAPKQSSKYGVIFKMVYVPTDLKSSGSSSRLAMLKAKASGLFHNSTSGRSKRACFQVDGGVGNTIEPQTVLPDLNDFDYDSTVNCPHVSLERRHKKCELWTQTTTVGDKKNIYKMWVARNESTGQVIPVHYYMLGYDSLLGSHYDRYDVSYYNFKPGAATDADFVLDGPGERDCGSMPGPGESASEAERRAHMIIQNPIHEYVQAPHRYDHVDHEFSQFVDKHEKDYTGPEHQRQSWFNFLHNFRFINGKNRELKEYKLKVNRFADVNVKDLSYLRGRRHSTGYNGGLDYAKHHNLLRGSDGLSKKDKVPDSWDWRIRGAVTPVKDQAVCGSCWSFGTSGTLEGAYFVKTGKLLKLSQQQLIDCSWKYGNNGCDGGEDFRAYKYLMEAGGIGTEEDYGHYLGVDGKCHDDSIDKPVKISGFYNVTMGDREALKHAVYNYGPVSVSIDASRPTFTFYSHGVYYDPKCNNNEDGLDHSVLVVGYTEIDGKFVWQVKNSWSTYWGDDGYIMMSAENNNCGVMDAPTVPIIKV